MLLNHYAPPENKVSLYPFTNIPNRQSWGIDKNHIHRGVYHDVIKVGYLMEVLVTWTLIRTTLSFIGKTDHAHMRHETTKYTPIVPNIMFKGQRMVRSQIIWWPKLQHRGGQKGLCCVQQQLSLSLSYYCTMVLECSSCFCIIITII